jgi:tritrans,polycis-undecaprenyl-diphosphate synthase [geranylgeranyl-diphosphate specific]
MLSGQKSKMDNPKHIAIILDGNRRFAKRLVMKPWKGHEYGAEKLRNLFTWCQEFDIKEITVYCLSIQNFNRPKKEFDYLMDLFEKEFKDIKNDKRIHENKIKINFAGRMHMLPEKVQKAANNLIEITKGYDGYVFNICMAYGGREEIIDAVNRIMKTGAKEINEKMLDKSMLVRSQPDLIIRTGGERRTSNFMIWQSPYSEWFFLDKMWPEFEKQDLINVLSEFSHRERRMGK